MSLPSNLAPQDAEHQQERIDALPELAAIWAQLAAIPADENCLSSVKGPFQALLTPTFTQRLINFELERMARDRHALDPRSNDKSIPLLEAYGYTLSMVFYEQLEQLPRPANWIFGLTEDHILGVLCGADLNVEMFEQTFSDNSVLDRSKTLQRASVFKLAPGDVIENHAGHTAFEIQRTTTLPTVAMGLSGPRRLEYIWQYNRETLAPERISSSNLQTTRMQYAIQTLAHVREPSSISPLQTLANHPAHEIRWEAARALVKLDINAGLPVLSNMLKDKHPHLRAGAARALAVLSA